jgi:hypothetical protein
VEYPGRVVREKVSTIMTEYTEKVLFDIENYAHRRLAELPVRVREWHLTTIIELVEEVRRLRMENDVMRAKNALTGETICQS